MSDPTSPYLRSNRYTSEAARLLNVVRAHANGRIKQAQAQRTQQVGEAHASALTKLTQARKEATSLLGTNLRGIYLYQSTEENVISVMPKDISGLGAWVYIEPNGSVTGVGEFSPDAFFGSDEVFFSTIDDKRTPIAPQEKQIFRWLYSSGHDGSNEQMIESRGLQEYDRDYEKMLHDRGLDILYQHIFQQSALEVDEVAQCVFWMGADGWLCRSDLVGGGFTKLYFSQNAIPWMKENLVPKAYILLDHENKILYFLHCGIIGIIEYSGEFNEGGFIETNNGNSVFFDKISRRIYWFEDLNICSCDTKGSDKRVHIIDDLILDPVFDQSTQVVYGISTPNIDSTDGSTKVIYNLVSTSLAGEVPDKLEFQVVDGFSTSPLADGMRSRRLRIVTQADQAQGNLSKAHDELHDAHESKTRRIAAAHEDAGAKRQQAHNGLDAAHAKASAEISGAQGEAAGRRESAKANARAKHEAGALRVVEAQAAADQRSAQAADQSKTIVDGKKQQAATMRAPSQALLDAARRRLQNT